MIKKFILPILLGILIFSLAFSEEKTDIVHKGFAFNVLDSLGESPRFADSMSFTLMPFGDITDTIWSLVLDSTDIANGFGPSGTHAANKKTLLLLPPTSELAHWWVRPPTGDSVGAYVLDIYVRVGYDTDANGSLDRFFDAHKYYTWKTRWEEEVLADRQKRTINYYIDTAGSNTNSGLSWDSAWADINQISSIKDSSYDRVNIFIGPGEYYKAQICTLFVDNTHVYGAGSAATYLHTDTTVDNSFITFFREYVNCLDTINGDATGNGPPVSATDVQKAKCFAYNPTMFLFAAKNIELTGVKISTGTIPDTVADSAQSGNVCVTEPVFINAIQIKVGADNFYIHDIIIDSTHKAIGTWPRGVTNDGNSVVTNVPVNFGRIENVIFNDCECHAIDMSISNSVLRNLRISKVWPPFTGASGIQLYLNSRHNLIENVFMDSIPAVFQTVSDSKWNVFRNNHFTFNNDVPIVFNYINDSVNGNFFDKSSWGYEEAGNIPDDGIFNGSFELPSYSVLNPTGWTSVGPDPTVNDSSFHRLIGIPGYGYSGNWGFFLRDDGTGTAKLRTVSMGLQARRYLLRFAVREDSDVSDFSFKLFHSDDLTTPVEDTTGIDAGSNTWSFRTIEFNVPVDGNYIIEIATGDNGTSDKIAVDDFTLVSYEIDAFNSLARTNFRNGTDSRIVDSIEFYNPSDPSTIVMTQFYTASGTKVSSATVKWHLIVRVE